MSRNSKKEKLAGFLRTHGMRFVAWGALVFALVLILMWVTTRTWATATGRSEFALNAQSLTVKEWPASVRADHMLQELRTETQGVLSGRNAFDPDVCQKVEHELRSCPWVLQVRRVYRSLPDGVVADVTFREPAGVVLAGSKRFLVDNDGLWLPAWFYQKPEGWTDKQPPLIVSRKLAYHPQTGRPVDQRSLAIGARLSAFLMKEKFLKELSIASIDVTNVGKRSTEPDVVLVTDGGVALKWGTTDAYETVRGLSRSAEENSDFQKLHMLKTRLDEYPGLKGLEYIDLRFNKVFFRPAASAKL